MAASFDLVVRGATIVDGSGGTPFRGDVAVKDGVIAAVGEVAGAGREEIDAAGAIVTPGFVDIHTHYDGQATWDPYLTPSSYHGVTSIVFGNCGVSFAPCWKDDHGFLIELMVSSPSPSASVRRAHTHSRGGWNRKEWRTSPARPCTPASTGSGSRSLSTWTRWRPSRAAWTSPPRSRTVPCGRSAWASGPWTSTRPSPTRT